MKWIGLTGGLGSGKSSVARFIREMGIPVVDADELARAAVSDQGPVMESLIGAFGPTIVDKQGQLDRKALGRIVFSDPKSLSRLEGIIHPVVRELTRKSRDQLEKQGQALAFYDVPLLFEKNLQDQFDAIVVVSAPEEIRISRVMKRDNLGRAEVIQRMSSQMPLEVKIDRATVVINNDGDLQTLKKQVVDVVHHLITMPTRIPQPRRE